VNCPVVDKPDLDNKANIRRFIESFYARMLKDEQLAPIFFDVAEIDLNKHLPLICSYWEKLLLGEKGYQRHTMNIHRQLHAKHALKGENFERWLLLFVSAVDESFYGEGAERAKRIARSIAGNMQAGLDNVSARSASSLCDQQAGLAACHGHRK